MAINFRTPRQFVWILSALTLALSLLFIYDGWVSAQHMRHSNGVYNWLPTPVHTVESTVSDYAFAMIGGAPADDRISILAMDDDTFARLGFPFERKYYADVVDKLNALGVKVIVFDMLFTDPDRRSPQDDAIFALSIKNAGNVIIGGYIDRAASSSDSWLNLDVKYSFRYPLDILRRSAYMCASASVDQTIDSDGHIRNMQVFDYRSAYSSPPGTGYAAYSGKPIATVAAAAYALYTGQGPDKVYADFKNRNYYRLNIPDPVARPKSPGRQAAAPEHPVLLRSSYPEISFIDLLDGKLSDGEKSRLKGGIVFVASTSIGAYDHHPSPFGENFPGVMFHATMLDNMLNSSWLRVASPFWGWLGMLGMLWFSLVSFNLSLVWGGVLTCVLGFGWFLLYCVQFYKGMLGLVVMPEMGLLTGYIAVTVYRVVVEGREKRWVKNTFGQYLSPDLLQVLMNDPSKLKFGGEKREMTIFFLDIAHFTNISESLTPEELSQFLNRYLSALTAVILKNHGYVNKYIGDCIMAFWNAPIEEPDQRYLACLSGLECIAAVAELNKNLVAGLPETPAVRIGINSGIVNLGNYGSSTRFEYTVIGDEVNLASRMEGANKFFASHLLVAESSYLPVKDRLLGREIGRIRVVGKSVPIRVFELLAKRGSATKEQLALVDAFDRAAGPFALGDFVSALKIYEEALALAPSDPVTLRRVECVRGFIKDGAPGDWDGVFNLTSK
jgi:adenylate cyclase